MTGLWLHNKLKRIVSIKTIALIVAIVTIAAIASSCHRRPLEVYYRSLAEVVLEIDWMTEFKIYPTGMTVLVYDADGNLCQSFSRNEVDRAKLSLPVGKYTALVFNGDPDMYSSFSFVNISKLEDFCIVANMNRTRGTRSWDADTRYSWEPDETIGRGVVSFEITQEMLDKQLNFIDYRDRDEAYTHMATYTFQTVVQPLQTMIHIRVHVNGMEYMYRMETNIDGIADGCSMLTRWRNNTTCTIFYDSNKWGYTFDNPGSSNGWVTVSIPTWGEPHGKELQSERAPKDNVLRMNFTLRDKAHTEVYFEFDVGDLIEYHVAQRYKDHLVPDDVLRHLYLTINREIPLLPPVEPEEEMGSGFNAYVDPWDYGGEWDLGTF